VLGVSNVDVIIIDPSIAALVWSSVKFLLTVLAHNIAQQELLY